MKKYTSFFLSFLLIISIANGANFQSGKNVNISDEQSSDQYLAGNKVNVNAKVRGDIIAAGESVNVNDSVFGDLLISAGKVHVNSYVGDDIRVFGGIVEINGIVEGDLIVFAGEVTISEKALINGDVIAYTGQIILNGFVNGDFISSGGEISLNGDVGGNAVIKAGEIDLNGKILKDLSISGEEIIIGDNAQCNGSITYWSGQGEMDFSSVGASAVYDEELALVDKEFDWNALALLFGLGLISYWIIFILSAFIIILLLEHFFGKYFEQAAEVLSSKFILSFGYGMLYLIGVPVLILLLFVMIIGFPVGLLLTCIYLMTLLFTASVSGLIVAHLFKIKYGKSWSYLETVTYAVLTVVILKVLFWIPVVGWLIKRVLGAAVYGAIILLMLKKKPALD